MSRQQPPHQVLRGDPQDNPTLWREEMALVAGAAGCFDILFPDQAPQRDIGGVELDAYRRDATWQSLAWRAKHRAADEILSAFISGPLWAYMLVRSPDNDFLTSPGKAVKLAEEAADMFAVAPATKRSKSRLLYELENASTDDYMTEGHLQKAKEWLGAAVLLSTDEEAVNARFSARWGLLPLPGNREVVRAQSMAETPNSSAPRGRKREPEAESSLGGPGRRRIKVEP